MWPKTFLKQVDQLIKKKERKIVKAFLKYIEKVYYHVQEYVLIRINDVWNDDYTEDHTKKKKAEDQLRLKKKRKIKGFLLLLSRFDFFFFLWLLGAAVRQCFLKK
jgi:hypothetical protein